MEERCLAYNLFKQGKFLKKFQYTDYCERYNYEIIRAKRLQQKLKLPQSCVLDHARFS